MLPDGKAECITIEQAEKEILSCRPMFFDMGGVTFTGGEATLQLDPLKALLALLKKDGVNTALETNATHPRLIELCGLVDYWMLDFKHPDSDKLKQVTGSGNEQIKQNIIALAANQTLHIRIPLIHGFNDDDDALNGFIAFFNELVRNRADFDVEILPYHEYGKEKWLSAGRAYAVIDGFVSDGTIGRFEDALRDNNIKFIHT